MSAAVKASVADAQAELDKALNGASDPDDGVLALPGVISENALSLPPGLSFEQWQGVGFTLRRINKAWRWWVGDWLNYGEREFGESYAQAMEETGLAYQDLAQCAYVASRVKPSMRRQALSWGHHAAVAPLEHAAAVDLLERAEKGKWRRQEIRDAAKGPKPIAPALTVDVQTKKAALLRFNPPGETAAEIVAGILRVSFPDAKTALDATYGNGNFWNGTAHVKVTGVDLNEHRAPDGKADFRDLPYDDESYDVVLLDPPHLADAGEESIMGQRFGTYAGHNLEQAVRDGAREAYRVSRLGVVAKVTDGVHGQEYVPMSDWVRKAVSAGTEHDGVPYDVVHETRAHAVIDPKWGEQLSAYNNGSTYLIFRKGSQRHTKRGPDAD